MLPEGVEGASPFGPKLSQCSQSPPATFTFHSVTTVSADLFL